MTMQEIPRWVVSNSYVQQHARLLEHIINGGFSSHELAAKAAPHVLDRIQSAWLDTKRRLMEDEAIPIEARHRLRRQINSDARAAVEAVRDGKDYHVNAWRTRLQPPPHTRTQTEELAHARIWRQLSRELEAGTPYGDLIKTADREQLSVLAEELPSIIRAKNVGNHEMLKADVLALADSLRGRWKEVGTEAEKQRIAQLEEIDSGAYRVEVAAKHLDYHISQDANDALPLPSWDGELVRPLEKPSSEWLGT